MRFNCGPTWAERCKAKRKRLSNWHSHFCWLPARIGPEHCVWLETVERKGELHPGYYFCGYWTWEYRIPV